MFCIVCHYYSAYLGPGLRWTSVDGASEQIATSRSGDIVWRVYKHSLYVGTPITMRHPAGKKWMEAAREVVHVSLDNNVGW